MRSVMRNMGAAVVVISLASCGPPTVDEIEGRSFSDVTGFQDAVSCKEHFSVFPHWAGEPPVVDAEDEAVEMATSLLDPTHPQVAAAVEAGEVWLLVDGDGFVFAAMESVGASIGGCSGY